MKFDEAREDLKGNINNNFSHAVLLYNDEDGYYTELHGGHAGNCCCNQHDDFVWRETEPYTTPEDIDHMYVFEDSETGEMGVRIADYDPEYVEEDESEDEE